MLQGPWQLQWLWQMPMLQLLLLLLTLACTLVCLLITLDQRGLSHMQVHIAESIHYTYCQSASMLLVMIDRGQRTDRGRWTDWLMLCNRRVMEVNGYVTGVVTVVVCNGCRSSEAPAAPVPTRGARWPAWGASKRTPLAKVQRTTHKYTCAPCTWTT